MKLFTILTFTNNGKEAWRDGKKHRWGVYEEEKAYRVAAAISSRMVCEDTYVEKSPEYVIVHEIKTNEEFPSVWFENQDYLPTCYDTGGVADVTNGSPQKVMKKLVSDLHRKKYITKVFYDGYEA